MSGHSCGIAPHRRDARLELTAASLSVYRITRESIEHRCCRHRRGGLIDVLTATPREQNALAIRYEV